MKTALIVGGGIGGLAAAVGLQAAGWRVRVFERASSPRELGFALNLASNALAALRELGVADAIVAAGHRPRRVEFRAGHGRVLRRVDAGRVGDDAAPVIAMRNAVHGALLSALDAAALVLGSEVTGFEAGQNAVRVRLRGGAGEQGDVLIGADGVGSAIRRQLHASEAAPRHSGYCAVRGVVRGAEEILGPLSGVAYFADGVECAIIRAGDDAAYWYVSLIRADLGADAGTPRRVVQPLQATLDDTFAQVVDRTLDGDMRYDELYDRDPISGWGTGAITLLGDAAHPMLPHTGQGAAQALEDAVALRLALARDDDIPRALRRYEEVRAARTAKLVAAGRRIVRLSTTRSGVRQRIRNAAIRMAPIGAIIAAYRVAGQRDPHRPLR